MGDSENDDDDGESVDDDGESDALALERGSVLRGLSEDSMQLFIS